MIGKPGPGSSNKTFVISYQTEEQRTSSLASTGGWLLAGAIVCFVVAAGFLLLAVILHR